METHEPSQPRLQSLLRLIECLSDEVAVLKAIGGSPPSRVANIKTIEAEIALLEEIEKQWRDKRSAAFDPKLEFDTEELANYQKGALEKSEEECCDLREKLRMAQKVIREAYTENQNAHCFALGKGLQECLDRQTASLRDCPIRTEAIK